MQNLTVVESCDTETFIETEMEVNRWPYRFLMPLTWLVTFIAWLKRGIFNIIGLPITINSIFFDGLGPGCRRVKEGAATWRALDVLYNFQARPGGLGQHVDNLWLRNLNSQAVRNRLRVVRGTIRRLLKDYLLRFPGQEIRVFSLACGSAQGVIEAIASMKAEDRKRIRLVLIDRDHTALEHALTLASEMNVDSCTIASCTNVFKIARIAGNQNVHIIEMVGLIDYLNDRAVIKLLEQIEKSLHPDGVLLTASITPNIERLFLKWVSSWEMIYRTCNQLRDLLVQGHFREVSVWTEPLGVHALALCSLTSIRRECYPVSGSTLSPSFIKREN